MTLYVNKSPLPEGVPVESGAASIPRAMSAWGRVVLIAALTLAFAATIFAQFPLMDWLELVLDEIPIIDYVSYSGLLAKILTKTAQIAVWSLPLFVSPQIRDIGSFQFPRTWTPLLVLPSLVLAVCFLTPFYFDSSPFPIPLLARLAIACYGMLTGVFEELVFRGYAFRRFPEAHPRLVILTSAAFFTLAHLINVRGNPIALVLTTFPYLFVFGLSLGIIRMASGSLAWCMLAHGAVNAFAKQGSTDLTGYKMVLFVTAIGIGAVTMLYLHPKLTGRSIPHDAPKCA